MPALANAKHEMFAQELTKGHNASEAYRTVFGKDNRRYASTLGQREDISGRVQDILAERAEMDREATAKACEALSIDKQWVLGRLVENAERAMQVTAVRDSEGQPTGEYKYDGSVANRSLELIGKELGMFVDRSENHNVNHDVSATPIDRSGEGWLAAHGSTH